MSSDDKYFDHAKLIRGYYEVKRLPRDFSPDRTVPDFAFNILHSLGLLYVPVVDEHNLNTGAARPIWPDSSSFAVCLTHDVDSMSQCSPRQRTRSRLERLKGSRSGLQAIRTGVAFGKDVVDFAMRIGQKDPLHCYERWLKVEESIGAHSTFFFWPGWRSVHKHHASDCIYDPLDRTEFDGQKCTIAEAIQEIHKRGWEIGLHPSWYSYNDTEEMKRQKAALEDIVGHEIVSVRQHFLHYDVRITPRVHADAGFRYDSTLGFNDNIGFRFGTCYPWYLYDLQKEEDLPIMEIPLIIQDGAMLNPAKGMRLDEDTAFEYVVQIAAKVEEVGGVLTLLWHPNTVVSPPWWNLYLRTLHYLDQRRAWFASVRQIGEWWGRGLERSKNIVGGGG